MRNISLVLCLLFLLCFSCSKEEQVDVNCVNEMLERLEMEPNRGQEIGGAFFVDLYVYNNKQYFLLGSHYADMASFPIDCEGNSLCGVGNLDACNDFYTNAVYLGITGISR
ncbi:MAG: hypothetical protein DHS20C18_37420 [Saprospiraceae bacterium]|nr:MAG: hypothetical protein DHS20C18_37420 [Saprospiraceae bacterium]